MSLPAAAAVKSFLAFMLELWNVELVAVVLSPMKNSENVRSPLPSSSLLHFLSHSLVLCVLGPELQGPRAAPGSQDGSTNLR